MNVVLHAMSDYEMAALRPEAVVSVVPDTVRPGKYNVEVDTSGPLVHGLTTAFRGSHPDDADRDLVA